jgi:alkylation response protein AidB-like acyl-CoA dehydrogenase
VLRDWGRDDLALARLAEGHADAVAVLAEAGRPTRSGVLYGVWAARSGPGLWLDDGRLSGTLRFCSGAHSLERALVVARGGRGDQLVDVGLRDARIEPVAGTWCPVGMAASDSPDVRFVEVPVDRSQFVGSPGFYTRRPGFWHGGAGVAAVWLGGALGVIDDARRWLGEHGSNDFQRAELGRMHVAVEHTEALLRRLAPGIDSAPEDPHQTAVTVARSSAEQTARCVLSSAPRLLGATGLCRDASAPRRLADLEVYIRQHHGERDLAAVGERLLAAGSSAGAP